MAAKLELDKLGRIVLPKRARGKLQLAAGDRLELERLDDQITLRALRDTAQLREKRCVLVLHCGEPLPAATVQETIDQIRGARVIKIPGKGSEAVLRYLDADPGLP